MGYVTCAWVHPVLAALQNKLDNATEPTNIEFKRSDTFEQNSMNTKVHWEKKIRKTLLKFKSSESTYVNVYLLLVPFPYFLEV
jgi:hypothetical protein